MPLAARTSAQRDRLGNAILARLPWATPPGQIDEAFARQAAAGSQGGLAEHIASSWLNIDRHLEAYGQLGTLSAKERDAVSVVRDALRRVQVPAVIVLLVVLILQVITS